MRNAALSALGLLALLGVLWLLAATHTKQAESTTTPAFKYADPGAHQAGLPDWKFERFIPLPEAPEPSGLCFSPQRQCFYLVDDGDSYARRPARLWELSLEGKPIRSLDLGRDLEGVCWASGPDLVFVVDEFDGRVYAVDPASFRVAASIQVSERSGGKAAFSRGGNGFEGIEYLPEPREQGQGRLLLLNQDDPTCIGILPVRSVLDGKRHGVAECIKVFELEQMNAGEIRLSADSRDLWVVHSWMNVAEILDPQSLALRSWVVMPGCAQEGLAFDGQGRMWVGQDTGGLAVYLCLQDFHN